MKPPGKVCTTKTFREQNKMWAPNAHVSLELQAIVVIVKTHAFSLNNLATLLIARKPPVNCFGKGGCKTLKVDCCLIVGVEGKRNKSGRENAFPMKTKRLNESQLTVSFFGDVYRF